MPSRGMKIRSHEGGQRKRAGCICRADRGGAGRLFNRKEQQVHLGNPPEPQVLGLCSELSWRRTGDPTCLQVTDAGGSSCPFLTPPSSQAQITGSHSSRPLHLQGPPLRILPWMPGCPLDTFPDWPRRSQSHPPCPGHHPPGTPPPHSSWKQNRLGSQADSGWNPCVSLDLLFGQVS